MIVPRPNSTSCTSCCKEMGSTIKHWKEAASLIIFARTKGGQQLPTTSSAIRTFDYRVLLLTRNFRGSFAGAHVFPGGVIDKADFSPSWLELFADAGASTDCGVLTSIKGPRPPILAENRHSPVSNDIAFRICAIREAFEESGILLVKNFEHSSGISVNTSVPYGSVLSNDGIPSNLLKMWRKRVHKDASQFISLCRELKCVPDLWALAEWSNWLTPVGSPRRFDTMFYTCCLENIPVVEHDKSEIIQSQWAHPEDVLQQYYIGKIKFIGPQTFELSRISRFPMLNDLHHFISNRALLGCIRYIPKLYTLQDGAIIVREGDDLYPSETNSDATTTSFETVDHLDDTIASSRDKCRNLNRTEIYKSTSSRDHQCNVSLSCGHLPPRPVQDFKTTPQL